MSKINKTQNVKNVKNVKSIRDVEQFGKNFIPVAMTPIDFDENKFWRQPAETYPPIIIKFDNPDKIKTISWKAFMDADGNLIIKKPMNFDTQNDRDFFARLFEAPESMSREEFYKYFEENPIGMIYYNDLSEKGKRIVDTMEEIPTSF